ncbi:MAG: glyoxylate/hydroxypyruvate reductase A [Pseudomonadota bacterium]
MTTPRKILCLCQQYDLREMFGDGFKAHPDLELVLPDEVTDPTQIKYVLAFRPLPDAFDPLRDLRMVMSVGAGVDGLLLHPGLPSDVPLIRMVNPEQAEMMAGFAAWHVVGHHRGMLDFPAFQRDRLWKAGHCIDMPSSFPVTVLGFGNMGRAIGRALAAMGYPVRAWAGRARVEDGIEVLAGEDGLRQVLAEAKAVVGVLPLTDATRGFFNFRTFAMMRPDALLVQLGRGGHLIEDDLIAALDTGQLARAALDVFQTEPLPPESPLWTHPKVMVTPHIASDSSGSAVAAAVYASITSHESGRRPEGLVDRDRGY